MRWHRLSAIMRKEIIQISRDLPSLLITVAMPLLLMLAFGYGVRFDIQHIPVLIHGPPQIHASAIDRDNFHRDASVCLRVDAIS